MKVKIIAQDAQKQSDFHYECEISDCVIVLSAVLLASAVVAGLALRKGKK